jgi:hypothetical protein
MVTDFISVRNAGQRPGLGRQLVAMSRPCREHSTHEYPGPGFDTTAGLALQEFRTPCLHAKIASSFWLPNVSDYAPDETQVFPGARQEHLVA